ncbi:MAG: plasmid mobilization relaxosome protein MobC [Candidatus Melainabacteria bacterium]|nr:plasmid mobilization relaxosome protein MobC [Candidatus Melainabacteria bacterium]
MSSASTSQTTLNLAAIFSSAAGACEQPKPTTGQKPPPPFSLRLTFEERCQLERDAGGMSLGAYIRQRLFGEKAKPRKSRNKRPVKDQQTLAAVLAALGASRIASNLNQIAKSANMGTIEVNPALEQELDEACQHVRHIRFMLMRSLGMIEAEEGADVDS